LTYEELGDMFLPFAPLPVTTPEPSTAPPTPRPTLPPPPIVSALPPQEVDRTKPMIALTFDDGPSSVTLRVLDLLEQYNARATFCVIGNRVESYHYTVLRAAELNCEVVGHSWDHKNLTKLGAERIHDELYDTNAAIYAVTGKLPNLYRPPYGAVNDTLKAVSAEENLGLLLWSIDTRDWKTLDAEATITHIMENAKDGAIILCHDIYGTTADAMEYAIPWLINEGYQLVTVSELFGETEIVPGTQYTGVR
jgi:peptidoglycan/xylan/chitin deacetylase (PgdA/CDA1 family)